MLIAPTSPVDSNGKLMTWSAHAEQFASILTDGNVTSPSWFMNAMEHSVTVIPNTGKKQLTVNALFESEEAAETGRQRLQTFLDGAAPLEEPVAAAGSCPAIPSTDQHVTIHGPGDFHVYGDNTTGWTVLQDYTCDECVSFIDSLEFDFCVAGIPVSEDGFWVSSNGYVTWLSSVSTFSTNTASNPNQPTLIINRSDLDAEQGSGQNGMFAKYFPSGPEGEVFVIRSEGGYWSDSTSDVKWELVLFADNRMRVARLSDSGQSNTDVPAGEGGSWTGLSDGDGTWIVGGDVEGGVPINSAALLSSAVSSPTPMEVATLLFGRAITVSNIPVEPRVYRWVAPTTSAELQVLPTGLTVESVAFATNCSESGCWVVEAIYTTGEDNFNTFFLPNAPGDDTLSYDFDYTRRDSLPWSTWATSIDDTYSPRNFPCGTNDYDPTLVHNKSASRTAYPAPPDQASLCCLPQFLDLYRPTQEFNDWLTRHKHMTVTKEACDAGFVYSMQRPGYEGPVEPIGPFNADEPVAVACSGDRAGPGDAISAPDTVLCFNVQGEEGYIAHGNYPLNQVVTWLIAGEAGQKVTVRMLHLMLEALYDFVKIEACADASCAAAGRTTLMPWASGTWATAFEVESCTGFVLVSFSSDFLESSYGFGLEYWISDDACSRRSGAENGLVPSEDHPDHVSTTTVGGVIYLNGQETASFEEPTAPAVVNPVSAYIPMPGNMLEGPFRGMDASWVEFVAVVDPYIKQYRARFYLDEVELRRLAGQLRGTVGVEHTVDTFVGIANWKPTGRKALDSFATQVALHLEKTNFFSVATHGVNDYTFLEYVNLRLVSIYFEDTDFSDAGNETAMRVVRTRPRPATHYVQVTMTLGAKYGVNENEGLIPGSSVRAGSGTFLAEASLEHKCDMWAAQPQAGDSNCFQDQPSSTGCDIAECEAAVCGADNWCCNNQWDQICADAAFNEPACASGLLPSFEGKSVMELALSQGCAPAAAMCQSPTDIPDSFVVFNIPLGVDFLGDASPTLSNNIFVDLVISAVDLEARAASTAPNSGEGPWQMKTTLTGSIPVVEGGVNIFCDGILAKTDLKDVANADIVVGSASTEEELSRLRIKEDIASTSLSPGAITQIDSDSIEAGLMTLVLKGNESYFQSNAGRLSVTIELEDVITLHIMDSDGDGADTTVSDNVMALITMAPDDNSDSAGLITDGYALNGAFRFTIDRSAQRAHLEPTDALLGNCSVNPPRPLPGNVPLETCVLRRDVRFRNYPWRAGGASTAMEICTGAAPGTPISAGSCPSASTSSDEAGFMASVLGDSAYSRQLAVDYASVIAARYRLNGRYRRAYWINPGYEWTPTQTGGVPVFSVSQKLFLFALITLDEGLSSDAGSSIGSDPGPTLRRRMLLQSTAEALRDGQSSVGAEAVEFETSPTQLMSAAYQVPIDRVATFRVRLQLTAAEACLAPAELQASLRSQLEEALSSAASPLHTVQVTAMAVDRADVACTRRAVRGLQAAWSGAVASVSMLVVFKEGGAAAVDLAQLQAVPAVEAVEPLIVSPKVDTSADVVLPPRVEDTEGEEEGGGGSWNSGLIGGVVGGVVGALALMLVGAVLFARGRNEPPAVASLQSVDVEALKVQLADSE